MIAKNTLPQWSALTRLTSSALIFFQCFPSTTFGASLVLVSSKPRASLDPTTDTGKVTKARQHVMRVDTVCLTTPGALIEVTVNVPGYDTLLISYLKECVVDRTSF